MRTILRAALECIQTKPVWKTSDLKTLLLNLLADTEKQTLEIQKVTDHLTPSREVSFCRRHIDTIIEAARTPQHTDILMSYLNSIFEIPHEK